MIETGRVTVPTDVDVIDATIEIINRWKADTILSLIHISEPTRL